MRFLFMGTPPFAATILEALLAKGLRPIAVYTQPPRKAGRGHKPQKSAVHIMAEQAGIPVYTPSSLSSQEEEQRLQDLRPDVGIVVAYGLLLPSYFLHTPPHGFINIHASLLPRWRGAAPIQYAILAGDPSTGVTLMKLSETMDAGPIIASLTVPISDDLNTLSLGEKLAQAGAKLLLTSLEPYCQGKLPPHPQPTEGITYAPKIRKEEGSLSAHTKADILVRQVRAFYPNPGSYFIYQGTRIKVMQAIALSPSQTFAPSLWGTTIDSHLSIATPQGLFQPRIIQPAGKRPMSTEEFLRGSPIPLGEKILNQDAY